MAGEAQLEAMLEALYTRLNDDPVLQGLAPGGVHQTRRPQDQPEDVDPDTAFITIRLRPGGRRIGTLADARAARTAMVEVLGIVPGAGTTTAHRLAERFDELLEDHRLTLASPWVCTGCRPAVDSDLSTTDNGAEFDRLGAVYRVWLTKE